MATLNWIGKEKVVNHHLDVPFKTLKHIYTYKDGQKLTDGTRSENKIIHGDNLLALKSLLPEYEGKIKCIYIDPPYNTGNESWVYNDNVNHPKIKKWLGEVVGKEGEDLSRHDKWLCMMYPRLKLLWKLIREDGVIVISIDDSEVYTLRILLNEIFGTNNYLGSIIWKKKTNGNNVGFIPPVHEYLIVYAKNISKTILPGIKVSEDYINSYSNSDSDVRGPWKTMDLSANHKGPHFPIINPNTQKVYFPPAGRYWVFNEDEVKKRIADGRIIFGKKGLTGPIQRIFLYERNISRKKIETWWDDKGYNSDGMKELSNIFDEAKLFDHPKPTSLLETVIDSMTDSDDIVLDSFAGSGTTAHAVLKLNKKNKCNRKFILVELEDYAESITAERIRRVIDGYGADKNMVEGLKGSFEYFELGDPLFTEAGYINENQPIEDIRSYVYYSETRTNNGYSKKPHNKYYLGKRNNIAYYFYYEKEKVTTLDLSFIAGIEIKADNFIVYADKCALSERYLNEHNITFKKIPRDIARI